MARHVGKIVAPLVSCNKVLSIPISRDHVSVVEGMHTDCNAGVAEPGFFDKWIAEQSARSATIQVIVLGCQGVAL